MSITDVDYAIASDVPGLKSEITRLIALGFYPPAGAPPAMLDGQMAQLMVKGSEPGALAELEGNIEPAILGAVGVAAAGAVAVESGAGNYHVTQLTLTNFAVGNSGDNASLAIGALLYTLPDGAILIDAAFVDVALTLADAVQTDTPELGIGTVIGSGANATLGAVGATSENVFEGTAVADVTGAVPLQTAKQPTVATTLLIQNAGVKTLYLNVADGWANLTAASAVTATGVVRLFWRFLGEPAA